MFDTIIERSGVGNCISLHHLHKKAFKELLILELISYFSADLSAGLHRKVSNVWIDPDTGYFFVTVKTNQPVQ